MSLIDVFLLGWILLLSVWWSFYARRGERFFTLQIAVAALLLVAQLALEGLYLPFLPLYLLLVVAFLLRASRRNYSSESGRFTRAIGSLIVVALMLLAVVAWTFLPVPRLPQPGGRYAVGTQIYRWTDSSRPEDATPDSADRRSVIVQAWYPAVPGTGDGQSTYIDGLGRLPPYISVLPRAVFHSFRHVDTHGLLNAALSADKPQWPVVLFSPGYGAPRAAYTGLISALSSRGFVVLAVDHPFEAAVTELPDGQLATAIEQFSPNDPDRTAYMAAHLELRAADLQFVLNQLERCGVLSSPLAGHLDLEHIGVIGHSFGGAASAALAARDTRVKAAANVDGTLYGSVSAQHLQQPFLLLQSDFAETHHSRQFVDGNGTLLRDLNAPGYHYEIKRANHYSFTDMPLFFSPPARFLLARVIGGERGPAETQQAAADILAAFLEGPLTGVPADLDAAAKRYSRIEGGPVTPLNERAKALPSQ